MIVQSYSYIAGIPGVLIEEENGEGETIAAKTLYRVVQVILSPGHKSKWSRRCEGFDTLG
jgi:hypothetical protein